MTEPQPCSLISYTDMNESFAESFGEINTDGGDNPHTHTHISVGQESTGGCGSGGSVILNSNWIVIGDKVGTGGSKGVRRENTGERE